jgi:hypothetical protein
MRRSLVVALALLSAATVAPVALGQDPPPPPPPTEAPPEVPAIGQYVETVPSATGGQAVGVGKSRTKPLPKKAAKKLNREASPLAPKLRSVATSSTYGAPVQTVTRKAAPTKRTHSAKPRAQSPRPDRSEPTGSAEAERSPAVDRTALSAAVSAATGGGDRGPVLLLVVVVLLTTAAGLLAAARRARQRELNPPRRAR